MGPPTYRPVADLQCACHVGPREPALSLTMGFAQVAGLRGSRTEDVTWSRG